MDFILFFSCESTLEQLHPGRGPIDNHIIAKEVFHSMQKCRKKHEILAFKIDLQKAYDRIRWGSLENTLIDFGFPNVVRNLILWCVHTSSLSIWKSYILDNFSPHRRLRQRDPISPYLLCYAWRNWFRASIKNWG